METIYRLEFNKNDYKKIVKYKTRKTINLEIYDKSFKFNEQDRIRELDYKSTNL